MATEHKINEKVILPDGSPATVRESADNSCDGCAFIGTSPCRKPASWHCFADWRKDNRHIIYVREDNLQSP